VRLVSATLALLFFAGYSSLAAAAQEKRGAGNAHGAIAYHAGSGSTGWATDRRTSREARIEALKQCGHEQCVVVATVTRNCAALARTPKKFIVQKGATRQEAETKALGKCGAGCAVAAWTCTR
jgi:Domain of unknown function (DUF4189)